MPLVKLSAAEKRKVSVFCTCLLLATVAWVLTGLGSTYDFKEKGVLSYKNPPQVKAYHSLQSDTVNVTLRGTGWQLLFSKMNKDMPTIPIDLQNLKFQNYIATSNQLQDINNSKATDQKIIAINPDTLYFDFTKRMVKKVPVELLSNIAYQNQYAPFNNPRFKPAEVTISGPANLVEPIHSWKTDSLKLSDVDETIDATVDLQPVQEGNISIYPKTVQVHIPVDEYTEKTVEVPVKLVNNTHYYNVKLFPQKVKVTFLISLRRYKETDEDFFEADVDLKLWEQNHYSVLPVNLTRTPSFCKIVRVEPRNIDFIVKK